MQLKSNINSKFCLPKIKEQKQRLKNFEQIKMHYEVPDITNAF